MDDSLYFTEQHLAVREMVRSFASEEVAPVAAHLIAARAYNGRAPAEPPYAELS